MEPGRPTSLGGADPSSRPPRALPACAAVRDRPSRSGNRTGIPAGRSHRRARPRPPHPHPARARGGRPAPSTNPARYPTGRHLVEATARARPPTSTVNPTGPPPHRPPPARPRPKPPARTGRPTSTVNRPGPPPRRPPPASPGGRPVDHPHTPPPHRHPPVEQFLPPPPRPPDVPRERPRPHQPAAAALPRQRLRRRRIEEQQPHRAPARRAHHSQQRPGRSPRRRLVDHDGPVRGQRPAGHPQPVPRVHHRPVPPVRHRRDHRRQPRTDLGGVRHREPRGRVAEHGRLARAGPPAPCRGARVRGRRARSCPPNVSAKVMVPLLSIHGV
ncbi:hypothetical protein SAMN04489730_2980 [Amycolatopsis australiensis]|uniref:Uncharacterized protein n=1 Tax=Amycolatopsis australiensis TaxID=546364 RepID=A0A1K1RBB4_9PSEU|nr:hypothetical protein SAMN04489730_2980 [Amycolatopsis australiensis]